MRNPKLEIRNKFKGEMTQVRNSSGLATDETRVAASGQSAGNGQDRGHLVRLQCPTTCQWLKIRSFWCHSDLSGQDARGPADILSAYDSRLPVIEIGAAFCVTPI